jgi:hypothetical protein
MQTTRQAALRLTATEFYPFLPAARWTAAARLSKLVARHRGICPKPADGASRVLSDVHFMFRGGESGTEALPGDDLFHKPR